MIPDIVVDIGNSRMKWGLQRAGEIVDAVSLPLDSVIAWDQQARAWPIDTQTRWVVASVNPAAANRLHFWLKDKHAEVHAIESYQKIPLAIAVTEPERVGLDRLLACLAAKNSRTKTHPCLVVQLGTATVINAMDADGVFLGGAIFPGYTLMSQALNQRTAALPEVPFPEQSQIEIGRSTTTALQNGILAATVGGVERCLQEYQQYFNSDKITIYVTGGVMDHIRPLIRMPHQPFPHMVLTGILQTALSWH